MRAEHEGFMSAIDVSQLLQDISADSPTGENLEYDAAFQELEKEAAPKPERQMGDSVVPGEEPNWPDVRHHAIALLGRTKDLRIAVQLTRSLIRTDGFVGLSEGLDLVAGMLERHWEKLHPQLDPSDGNDPTFRVNAVAGLADWDTVVRPVRELPLVDARAAGRYALRDIEIANGTSPTPEGAEAPSMGVIEAAFIEADLADLQATAGAIQAGLQSLGRITNAISEKADAVVDLGRLSSVLRTAERTLAEQLGRRGAEGGSVAEGGDGGAPRASGGAARPSGEVESREDVIRLLDKCCEYYRRHEPSSPIPLLLQRAKRLVSKDFLELVQDLAPGGVSEVRSIGGLPDE
jgi:type VI secretion system protein ImpA